MIGTTLWSFSSSSLHFLFTKLWKSKLEIFLFFDSSSQVMALAANATPSQWTRVNLNLYRTNPCAVLYDVRQVPARPYPMQAKFQLWWRGQTFYSTQPIIGLFYLPHYIVQCAILINISYSFSFNFTLIMSICILCRLMKKNV